MLARQRIPCALGWARLRTWTSHTHSSRNSVAVSCLPTFESLLERELRELGWATGLQRITGGISLSLSRSEMWSLALRMRLADTLRVQIHTERFEAKTLPALTAQLEHLPWESFLAPNNVSAFTIKASSHRSSLSNLLDIENCVKQFLQAWCVRNLSMETHKKPITSRIYAHFNEEKCLVALGESLVPRGYEDDVRGDAEKIHETLAAGLLRMANWPLRSRTPRRTPQVLWDPFCGTGIVAIEALRDAAGLVRPLHCFGFESWPTHSVDAYHDVVEGVMRAEKERAKLCGRIEVIASDTDAWAVETAASGLLRLVPTAKVNVSQAAFLTERHFEIDDASSVVRLLVANVNDASEMVPEGATIITKPPIHAASSVLRRRYAQFGNMLRQRKDLVRVFVIAMHPDFKTWVGKGLAWRTIGNFFLARRRVTILQLEERKGG